MFILIYLMLISFIIVMHNNIFKFILITEFVVNTLRFMTLHVLIIDFLYLNFYLTFHDHYLFILLYFLLSLVPPSNLPVYVRCFVINF
jgi:hypothetical protein